MNLWYVVEEKSLYDKERKQIGLPISAKIVKIFPRNTDGFHEWHDTETIEDSVYILRKWCRTKTDANNEIRHHLRNTV